MFYHIHMDSHDCFIDYLKVSTILDSMCDKSVSVHRHLVYFKFGHKHHLDVYQFVCCKMSRRVSVCLMQNE